MLTGKLKNWLNNRLKNWISIVVCRINFLPYKTKKDEFLTVSAHFWIFYMIIFVDLIVLSKLWLGLVDYFFFVCRPLSLFHEFPELFFWETRWHFNFWLKNVHLFVVSFFEDLNSTKGWRTVVKLTRLRRGYVNFMW